MRTLKYAVVISLFSVLSACGGSSGDTEENGVPTGGDTGPNSTPMALSYVTPAGVEECSSEDIKGRVEFDMRDYYVYYKDVPQLNPDDYDTPEDYIRALRVEPDIYSGLRDAQRQASLFDAGETQGYGFSISKTDDGITRFRNVAMGSSVEEAGVLRGDAFVEINGVPYDDVTGEGFSAAFLREEGNTVDVMVQTGDDAPRAVQFENRVYRWKTAGPANRFATSANPTVATIGYLPVRSFLETTRDDINDAFAELRAGGEIEELILDLRYNGGGRVRVANYLASVIGGDKVGGEVAAQYIHNDKLPGKNYQDKFDIVQFPLNLSRVIVLTTNRSASSSEIVINSLKPYMDVVVIGEATEGKAFISSAREYCGKAINAMEAIGENAAGMNVLGGLQPVCEVEDTWFTPADDINDPLLRSALGYAAGDNCGAMIASHNDLFRVATRAPAETRGDIPMNPLLEY